MMALDQPLSAAELEELDDFLADEAIQETSMDVSTLEGFLTAIAIGPRFVRPTEWLPWIWDMDEGDAEPEFENEEEANRITLLIMRLYNTVMNTFNTDPASFEPLFWCGNQWGAAEWSEGFILGFQFNEEAWSLLAVGKPTWFTPFLRLGTGEGIDITIGADDAEKWMNEIEPSLLRMHAYWKEN
ncbi:MAG: YecA family protein [Georgfuchsia sp.]